MTTQTYTTVGYNRLHELELIDDNLCDMYLHPHYWAKEPAEREALREKIGSIIEDLHAWRDKYGENI